MAAGPDDAILRLPIDERLALVDSIWESIRESAESLPVHERTRAEMQRRLDLHRDDPDAPRTTSMSSSLGSGRRIDAPGSGHARGAIRPR